jgi:hypothetical protein
VDVLLRLLLPPRPGRGPVTAALSHTGLRGPVPFRGRAGLSLIRYQKPGTMSVSYKLYRQIRDHAPQDWTSGELVVALMIADAANDASLRAYITPPELCARARMTDRALRDNLCKLSARGFEFRVAVGKDRHGNSLYGIPGKRSEYQVPDIFPRLAKGAAVAYGLVDKPPEGGTGVPP